jgi:Flp pilus assembly protein TadG
MSLIRRLKSTVSNFAADQSGQYAILFALCSGVIMISVGLSVDYTRIISARSQLTSALDAAVTSTARDITRGKIDKKEATKMVWAFLEANLDGKRLTKENVHLTDVTLDPVTNELSASARADVDMMFPVMNNPKVQPVNVEIGALYSERKVEVSMVLDVTGSMGDPVGGSTKIVELKKAAKSAVKSFLENGSDNTRVAITPYSYGVNVGTGALKGAVVGENGLPAPDSCAAERRGPLMFSDASPVAAKVTRPDTFSYFDVKKKEYYDIKHWDGKIGWKCPESTIQPLTRDAAVLNATIDKLKADGATAGQIGIQWGWYMLSPNWKSALPVKSEPVAYNSSDAEKYLILMTDGMFNTEASGLSNAAIPNHPGISLASGRLAMSYCAAIKDKKVKIYTIGFDLKHAGDAAQQTETVKMLTECASAPVGSEQTFYNAENGADLKKAFDDIARRIQTLRLTN